MLFVTKKEINELLKNEFGIGFIKAYNSKLNKDVKISNSKGIYLSSEGPMTVTNVHEEESQNLIIRLVDFLTTNLNGEHQFDGLYHKFTFNSDTKKEFQISFLEITFPKYVNSNYDPSYVNNYLVKVS